MLISISDFIHSYPEVPELDYIATLSNSWPLQFYRDYVSKNYPVVIRGGCAESNAIKLWNLDYFLYVQLLTYF